MNPTHVFCIITFTQGLLLVHSSSSSVRLDGHGLYSARTPTVVVNRHDSETCNDFVYVRYTYLLTVTYLLTGAESFLRS